MQMSPIAFILFFVSSSLFIENVTSAKILYMSYIGCKSTFSMHQTISKILLNNHHQITAVSPFPLGQTHANYTDLEVYDNFFQFSDQFSIDDELIGTYTNRKYEYEIQITNCQNLYQNTKLIATLKKMQIDLILLEMDAPECYFALLDHFQAPIIGISTQNIVFPDFDGVMGNPVNPSYVPSCLSGFSTRMNFFQRLQNVKNYLLHLGIGWYYNNEIKNMIKEVFGNYPKEEVFERISLVFTNDYYAILSKPLAPSTVAIGGIHIENPSPLPEKIQTFIEGSTKGVIYLSLGSVVSFSRLPKHIHDSFVKIMQKSEFRIIWRHDKPEMVPNTSGNILVQKWLPQKDILAHPKVIMFISHAGIFSTLEAIHFGVPVLAFPVIYDQFTNAAIIQNLGIGIFQDLYNFSEISFVSGIEEVVQNNKYRENMKKLSSVFRDRPQSPQQSLIYWVSYVLRHKDVTFLKPAGAKLPFYQYLLLDVILFFILMFILSGWIVLSIAKLCISVINQIVSKKLIRKSKKSL